MKKILKFILKMFVTFVIGGYCTLVYRVKTVGTEKVPKEGNVIFCGNHRSYLDPIIIELRSKRNIRFLAKEELKKNPIFYPIIYPFDPIFVKRNSKDVGPLKEALKTLKSNECIGLFPEGTRNGMEKNDGALKGGAAYLALKTGAKLVPIGVVGKAKPFSKNTFYYGDPIDVSEYQTKEKDKEKENIEKVTEIIKQEIIKLTSEQN